MNLPQYPYSSSDELRTFRFTSQGPKGLIRKIILYTKMTDDPDVYNLAFGDEDELTHHILDDVRSNNQDRDIVLATVASTVMEFSERYGNPYIYAEGSSPGRTRLYQMSIGKFLEKISYEFMVYGYLDNRWHSFKNNINYEAFLLKRR